MNRGRPKILKDPVRVLLSLDYETIKALDYLQRHSGVNRSQLIRIAIERFCAGEYEREALTDGKEEYKPGR